MNQKEKKKNLDNTIIRFYLYRFISRLSFYVPVLVVYFLAMDLNMTQIAVLIAAYGGMTSFTSLPPVTMYLTSIFTAKKMLMLGEILKALSVGLTYFSSDIVSTVNSHFWVLLIAQLIGGIGYSFAAGSDGRFLFTYCKEYDIPDYKQHEAHSSSTVFLSFLGAGVVGGIVSIVNIRLPFLLTLPAHIVCAILAISFRDIKQVKNSPKKKEKEKSTLMQELRNTELVSHMLYYSVSRAIIITLNVSIFPVYFFQTLEIPVWLFGIIFGSYTLTSFFVGKSTIKLREGFGEQKFSLFLIGCVLCTLVLLSFVHSKLVVLSPIIMYIMAGAIRPHTTTRINIAVKDNKNRANIIALMEGGFGFFNVIFVLVCYVILQKYDIYAVFQILLVFATALYGFLFALAKGKI